MSALVHSTPGSETAKTLDDVLSSVRETDSPQVSWHQWGGLLNDRRAHRVAFPAALHVVGLEINSDTGQFTPVAEAIIARGRDISVDGVSFQHDGPLPNRFVAVSFRSPFGTETLVAKLSWCRFGREDRYISGGRVTREPQLDRELTIDWDAVETAEECVS